MDQQYQQYMYQTKSAAADPETARIASELGFPLQFPSGVSTVQYGNMPNFPEDMSFLTSLQGAGVPPAMDTTPDWQGGMADFDMGTLGGLDFPQQQPVNHQYPITEPQMFPAAGNYPTLIGDSSGGILSPGSSIPSWSDGSTLFERRDSFQSQGQESMTKGSHPLGGAKLALFQEPATYAAQPHTNRIVSQLCTHEFNHASLPRPLSVFDDLPPLPDAFILNEILSIYFEKLPPIIAIIHEAAFYKSASLPPPTADSFANMRPPYHHNPPVLGLSPVLLYSMLACAARYHPAFEGQTDAVKQIFYERGKRLMLHQLEKPELNVLKALLHLTLFGVEHSLWLGAYMWLGSSVAMCRFLGLYKEMPAIAGGDANKEELVGGLAPQQIMAEESRRIFWWTRNYDASGSSASKRPQMISDAEYASTLLLPCPDSLFYATRYGLQPTSPTIPRTQTLDEFYSDVFGAELAHSSIGPNGYIHALTALFNRVTRFRQQCNNVNILPFSPGTDADVHGLLEEFARHQSELDMWFNKLPQWVKVLNSGEKDPRDPIVGRGMCWEEQWMRETYEWCIALVIYHATVATLHGPDYNMMTMGSQIAGSLQSLIPQGAGGPSFRPPPHIAAGFMTAARLDEVLTLWQNSQSFGKAIEHGAVGSRLLEEMAARVEKKRRRDTPFFGYCVCQLGLLNLIAARQLALMQRDIPQNAPQDSLSAVLKHRAESSISILQNQANVFSASKTGMQLLAKIMTEVAGGEITMRVMGELAKEGRAGSEGDKGMKELLVRKSMGNTAQKVMEEPSRCAGTMGVRGEKFGTIL